MAIVPVTRDAVGRGEAGRRAEGEHQRDHGDQQQPVDDRDVDLARLRVGGVPDASCRGRKPSWTACWVTENAPEITACEAITVATVASTTIGIRRPVRARAGRTGSSIALGIARISAPWPR